MTKKTQKIVLIMIIHKNNYSSHFDGFGISSVNNSYVIATLLACDFFIFNKLYTKIMLRKVLRCIESRFLDTCKANLHN